MSGFTPGPWVCDGATFEYEGARFGEAAYIVSKDYEQFPASAANARLIAAAPDLFAALRDMLDCTAPNGHSERAYRAAQVAIAKACGE